MTCKRRCRVDGGITECWTVVVSEEGGGLGRWKDEDGERGDETMAYASGACLSLCARRVESRYLRRRCGIWVAAVVARMPSSLSLPETTARRHAHVLVTIARRSVLVTIARRSQLDLNLLQVDLTLSPARLCVPMVLKPTEVVRLTRVEPDY